MDSRPSRLRLCTLQSTDLEILSLFLKNLAFTLHYNSTDLLQKPTDAEMAAVALSNAAASTAKTGGIAPSAPPPAAYDVIAGLDFETFKSIVTGTLRMLYERDSRRRFLPPGHWLMTSFFDMDGFLPAVVLEEKRQHELQENRGDSDDEEHRYDDDDDEDDIMYHPSTYAGQRLNHYAYVERVRAARKKARRDRIEAAVGPKMEILRNMPYTIPFEIRVQIFRQFVYLDKQRRRGGFIDQDRWRMHMMAQNGGLWGADGTGPEDRRPAARRDQAWQTIHRRVRPVLQTRRRPQGANPDHLC